MLIYGNFAEGKSVYEHNPEIDRTHNIVLAIITVACLAAIIESVAQGWELWFIPLILIGVVAAWVLHLMHYGKIRSRENFYIILSMVVSFYHGVHQTSFFDIVVISILLMVTITLMARKEYLVLSLIEYFIITIIQVIFAIRSGEFVFDALNISRIALHILSEICVYNGLTVLIGKLNKHDNEIKRLKEERKSDRENIEKFLGNIYRDLMIPVNTICEITTGMIKDKPDKNVFTILGCGMRLAWQIRDINDYSEIQRGTLELTEDSYMIANLLNEYIADYKSGVIKNNIDLIVDLDPEVPSVLYGDFYKLGKIIRLLGHNGIKFTEEGCINIKVSGVRREHGFNLMIEVSDTGIGMSSSVLEKLSKGNYLADRVHDATLGGIGLGLPIVYGFVRKMNGFVSIDSTLHQGTTVKICVPQTVVDDKPCLSVGSSFVNVAFYNMPEKYTVSQARDFYRAFVVNLAQGLRVNIYSVLSLGELKKLLSESDITHVFLAKEEYNDNPEYFDELADSGMNVIVSAYDDFNVRKGSHVIVMPKPLFALPVVRILSGYKGEGGRV